MIYNQETAHKTAKSLLQINAIKLNPKNPFTWASGWKSPIYCDNRIALSHPKTRSFLAQKILNAGNASPLFRPSFPSLRPNSSLLCLACSRNKAVRSACGPCVI